MAIQFDEFHGGPDSRNPAAFNPEFVYNGIPYIDQDERYRQTKHTSNRMYDEDIGELNCVLDALVRSGNIPASARKIDPNEFKALGPNVAIPDFDVVLKTGRKVFVEATIAGTQSTIQSEQTILDMSASLTQWSVSDEAAQSALAGHLLSFVPQNSIAARDEKPMMEELKRFIITERLEAFSGHSKIASPAYPVLSKADTLVMLHDASMSAGYAQIRPPATSYNPTEEYVSVLSAINRKITNGYEHFRPIWLVVAIAHVIEPWRDTFAAVRSSLTDLGPFERVFVANSNHSLRATALTFRSGV